MDKMITAMGAVLISLGVGFWIAFELIAGLHSAYLTGGVMWMALGVITIGVGLKKSERLSGQSKNEKISAFHKNAMS